MLCIAACHAHASAAPLRRSLPCGLCFAAPALCACVCAFWKKHMSRCLMRLLRAGAGAGAGARLHLSSLSLSLPAAVLTALDSGH
jgi:hypothetical protein